MTCDSFGTKILRAFMCVCLCLAVVVCGCNDPNVEETASKPVNPRNVPYQGNKPQIALGGGGAVDAEDPLDAMRNRRNNNADGSSLPNISTVSNIEGGLNNGLFPQMAASFSQNGFGGGLVPDFQNPAELDEVGLTGGETDAGGVDSDLATEEETEVEEQGPEGYLSDAIAAFRDRNEADGFKYLYAHVLTDPDASAKYSINWYSGINQPKIALRWGVGVAYAPPKSFEGKPPVIGDPENVRLANSSSPASSGRGGGIGTSGGGGGGSTGTEDSPYANVDTSQNEGFLLYYTGDFGDRLLTRLESRRLHDDAFYGELLKDLGKEYLTDDEPVSATTTSNTGRGRSIGPAGGGGGGGGGDVLGAGAGGGTTGAAGSSSNRIGHRLERVNGSSAAADPDPSQTGTLVPGVMLLGEGSKSDLLQRAKEMGLDGLLMFSTRVTSGRNPKGTAVIKVINVHTEEEVFKSRNLASDTVAKARERSSSEKTDPVALALDGLFKEMLDQKFKAQPLPENLKPEHVTQRINDLMSRSHSDPLPVAIEILAFRRMEMVDSELASQALDTILGEGAGNALLAGDLAARQAAIRDFLPDGSSDDDGGFR